MNLRLVSGFSQSRPAMLFAQARYGFEVEKLYYALLRWASPDPMARA